VHVAPLNGPAAARFTQAVLDGRPLGEALACAGTDFDFEAWLVHALQQQWLVAVLPAQTLDDGERA
jgi:hypothetical protein